MISGQRQRTAIARIPAMNPDLLLMDEPFSSLDALTREDLERLTLELREETGVSTVIVTHNIEEAVYRGADHEPVRPDPVLCGRRAGTAALSVAGSDLIHHAENWFSPLDLIAGAVYTVSQAWSYPQSEP
jgi:ABC-type sugar transport system ATPase subunit